jgi:hypothetical protein
MSCQIIATLCMSLSKLVITLEKLTLLTLTKMEILMVNGNSLRNRLLILNYSF